MQAKETKLQDIIEGTKQYVLPMFQRSYSWDRKEWEVLWNDLYELADMEVPRSHFIGSIVNMPTVSVPEGVSKFMLIDGQQRLTTVFILLTLLRDASKNNADESFADEINNTLLVNPYKKGSDYFKLLPTQVDRDDFQNLVLSTLDSNDSQIKNAYNYFEGRLKKDRIELIKLKKIITTYLSIVSIVLDGDDNPYLVFESLNAKGRPLTQADLIKNYFFMRIHVEQQDFIYSQYWKPMEERLGEKLTEYIRHFLMMDGLVIKQDDVYNSLKQRVNQDNAIEYLTLMSQSSVSYQKLLNPELEADILIRKYLFRLNRIEVTTAYPLLMNFYRDFSKGILTNNQFGRALNLLENFLIRRFVCGLPTNQLNKVFPTIISTLRISYPSNLLEGLSALLPSKGLPKNSTFRKCIIESKLYGSGDRKTKTKLILESIEEFYSHREIVPFENLTIEHIMPQTLTEWWQNHLGQQWELVYDLQLHNLGNLTLTAYNSDLSNDDFFAKKGFYKNSHLEINKYFGNLSSWKKEDIENRAYVLADILIKVWPYFGADDPEESEVQDVTGTNPKFVCIMGQNFQVTNWRDVLEITLNELSEMDVQLFEQFMDNYPRFINREKSKLRAIRVLKNGVFIEVNLSAKNIEKVCRLAIESFELSASDWKIIVN